MAGRYHDVASLRLSGDRARAQQHVPAARLLMGQVMEQAGFNGLTTHRLQRVHADGSQIIAEKIGDIARLSIHAPGRGSGMRPVPRRGALLIKAGSGGTSNESPPPIILDHDKDMNWRAYFAHSKVPGYYDEAGTYSAVFPRDHLPEGGRCFHANSEGIVTSWASEVLLVTPKGRHPMNIYDRYVYCLGRTLLYVRPEFRVLCAVIDEDALYVIISQLEALTYPTRPASPDGPGDAWASRWYSDAAHPTGLYRFPLETKVIAATGHHYYQAGPGALISAWGLMRYYSRWTFDNEKKQFVTVQLPRQPILRYVRGKLVEPPSNDEFIIRIGLNGQLSAEPANRVIFEEGGQQIQLVPVEGGFDYLTPHGICPALRAYYGVAELNTMVYAHCATGNYLVRHTVRWADASINVANGYEGSLMWVWPKEEDEATFSMGTNQATLRDRHVLIRKILPDMTGSGIATLCYGAVGWPVFDEDEPDNCRGMMDTGFNSDHAGSRYRVSGAAVGGLSLGAEDGAYWPDTHDYLLPFDPDTLDPVVPQVGRFNHNISAAVCDGVLAAYAYNQFPASTFASETYLPGENIGALIGPALRPMFFCPLGKPHPQQPRQVPG